MATINYTADDGSTVVFVDPAGVQAAVEAAIAALPTTPAPVVTETDTGITVTHEDGTTANFVPEQALPESTVESTS